MGSPSCGALSATAFVAVVGLVLMVARNSKRHPKQELDHQPWYVAKEESIPKEEEQPNIPTGVVVSLLPTHIQREIYKEARREIMRPAITMKRPMYDNIIMTDRRGKTLCTISLKKAHWYVNRDLAAWQSESEIQLQFEPSGDSSARHNSYNTAAKQNRCVVCGDTKNYMRHYVVPYCYRSLLPAHFKTHLPHDVVLLCPNCHVPADRAVQRRIQCLESAERRRLHLHPTQSAMVELVDPVLHRVRSAATALLDWQHAIPEPTIVRYEALVRDWAKVDVLNRIVLEQARQLECRRPNPDFVAGPTLIVNTLLKKTTTTTTTATTKQSSRNNDRVFVFDDEAIGTFVRDWRVLFLDSLHPRCLPTGWSVDAPVQCDHDRRTAVVNDHSPPHGHRRINATLSQQQQQQQQQQPQSCVPVV